MRYLAILLLFAGCNPVKQVLRSPEKTQAVVDAYNKNLPELESDSTSTPPAVVYDTVENVIFDTLYVPGDTIQGTAATIYITKTIRKQVNKTVTIRITKVDRDMARSFQRQAIQERTAKDQWKAEAEVNDKRASKMTLYFWLLVAAVVGYGALKIYLNTRKKVTL